MTPATAAMTWGGLAAWGYAVPVTAIAYFPLRQAVRHWGEAGAGLAAQAPLLLFGGFGCLWLLLALILLYQPVRLGNLWPHVYHVLTDRRLLEVDRRTGVTQAMVDNPNSVLKTAIQGLTITETTVFVISTDHTPVAGGGTSNTAFLQGAADGPNAKASKVTAIFWIEKVKGAAGQPDHLVLQYTQTVLLDFNGLSWPHVTVGTLRKKLPFNPLVAVDPKELENLDAKPSI